MPCVPSQSVILIPSTNLSVFSDEIKFSANTQTEQIFPIVEKRFVGPYIGNSLNREIKINRKELKMFLCSCRRGLLQESVLAFSSTTNVFETGSNDQRLVKVEHW